MRNTKTNYLVKVAILSAAAFVLQLIVPFKVGGFLDVELSDYAAIIGSFALGPMAGVLIELIKNIIHLSVSSTNGIGELANFIANGTFVFVAGVIYKYSKNKKGAVIGLISAIVAYTIVAGVANYFILLPLFMKGASVIDKFNLILYTITPFNVCKGIVISLITLLSYKKISPLLHK